MRLYEYIWLLIMGLFNHISQSPDLQCASAMCVPAICTLADHVLMHVTMHSHSDNLAGVGKVFHGRNSG